ncbi:MAG TPA: T9SS type A sorting domain-containing protein, partial [Bacteroidota bacterium]|nr:T9SS type A sorting domain-containing protein [Bacteroidota bacterium]
NNEVPGTSEYLLAQRQYLRKQEVQIAHFNAVLGINENEPLAANTTINSIFPNPAQNVTTLEYTVKGIVNIDIAIYDLLGKKLLNVFSGVQSEGVYSFNIDTKDLLSGSYYITLRCGDKTTTKILSIIK